MTSKHDQAHSSWTPLHGTAADGTKVNSWSSMTDGDQTLVKDKFGGVIKGTHQEAEVAARMILEARGYIVSLSSARGKSSGRPGGVRS